MVVKCDLCGCDCAKAETIKRYPISVNHDGTEIMRHICHDCMLAIINQAVHVWAFAEPK